MCRSRWEKMRSVPPCELSCVRQWRGSRRLLRKQWSAQCTEPRNCRPRLRGNALNNQGLSLFYKFFFIPSVENLYSLYVFFGIFRVRFWNLWIWVQILKAGAKKVSLRFFLGVLPNIIYLRLKRRFYITAEFISFIKLSFFRL